MFIKYKRDKGITLIALVVTIIVLLILAGISIQMLVGERGILTNAKDASESTKDANEDEQVRLAVAEALSNGTGTLTTDNIRKALENEFGTEKVTEDTFKGEGPWTFKGERKNYEISSTGKVQKAKDPVHAKDVLLTNLDGLEDYQKSPFVQYNDRMCRVLYNDEEHGLQIVTERCVGNVALGYGLSSSDRDTTVSPSDFDVGTDNGFKCAAASYNNAVSTLNKISEDYMDEDGIAVDSRCLGYEAGLENGKFKNENEDVFYSASYDFFSTYNGKLKAGDSYYEDDVKQVGQLGLGSGEIEWLASRYVSDYTDELSFMVSRLDDSKVLKANYLVHVRQSSLSKFNASCYGTSSGFRPVFLLWDDVVILSGDGTRGNPYILGH